MVKVIGNVIINIVRSLGFSLCIYLIGFNYRATRIALQCWSRRPGKVKFLYGLEVLRLLYCPRNLLSETNRNRTEQCFSAFRLLTGGRWLDRVSIYLEGMRSLF